MRFLLTATTDELETCQKIPGAVFKENHWEIYISSLNYLRETIVAAGGTVVIEPISKDESNLYGEKCPEMKMEVYNHYRE